MLGTDNVTTGATGAISSTLDVDPFGNTKPTGTTGTSGVQSPFGYAGQSGYQTDTDFGLMRVGYRYYDPSTGRFISRDPAQAGFNWHTYCENDPVNRIDPNGLDDYLFEMTQVLNPGWQEMISDLGSIWTTGNTIWG